MAEPAGGGLRPGGMLRRILTVAAFAALFTLAAPTARVFACSCMQLGAEQALANADVAFVGVVARVKEPNAGNPVLGSQDPIIYTFVVDEALKAAGAPQVTVSSARDGVACGVTFALAERWRVFAYADGSGGLATGLCSGNELLARGVPIPPPTVAAPPTALLLAIGAAVLLAGISVWAFTRRPRGDRPS